jgi:hypothetical protein
MQVMRLNSEHVALESENNRLKEQVLTQQRSLGWPPEQWLQAAFVLLHGVALMLPIFFGCI